MTGKEQKRHPKDKANFFSRATLWWIFGLLWKGNTKPLEEEDLYSVRNDDGAEHLTKRLQTIWNNEKSSASSLQRKPQFWKALLRFFTWKEYGFIVFTGSLYIIAANVVWYSTIKLLQCIGSNLHNDVPRERSFVYVYGMASGQLVSSISVNHFHLCGAVLGIRARAAVVGLLYKKVLQVSKTAIPAGHVIELLCDDSQRLFTSGEWFIQNAIRQFLMSACAIGWLFYFVGWQVVPGLLFSIFLGIYRSLIAKVDYKLRKNASRLADERLGYLREILTGIQSIKLNCFEEIFEEKILQTRRLEIKCKAKRWTIMAFSYSFMVYGQQLATFVSIVLLIFTNSTPLSYQTVFAIVILTGDVCRAFSVAIPSGLRLAIDVYTSLQRIQAFLETSYHLPQIHNCPENDPIRRVNIDDRSQMIETTTYQDKPLVQALLQEDEIADKKIVATKPYVRLCDITCKLPTSVTSSTQPTSQNAPMLNYVNLNVSEPGLVIITGPVGSGKSSLLQCILEGELLVTNGTVEHSGNLAYVSDMPWLFPGTIRENILFGLPYDEDKYLKTVKACELEMDLKVFPEGDMSRVGEHGATVSGGQRTRISLARAVYSQADVYLLDDPLSSLDAKVAENIFKNCLRGLLANRIILLTTSTARFLQEADYIVKLQRGVIVAQGNFESVEDEVMGEGSVGPQYHQMDVEEHPTQDQRKTSEQIKENEPESVSLREEKEDQEIGNVSFKVYKDFFMSGAPVFALLLVTLVYCFVQVLVVVVDLLVSRLPSLTGEEQRSHHDLIIYATVLAISIFLVICTTLCLLLVPVNASYTIHNKMVSSIIEAPLSFHATNPVGRIMNRFSQDINNLDELLPDNFTLFCLFFTRVLAALVLASIANVILIPLGLVTLLVFFFMSRFYLHTALDLKRLMSVAGGPLYSHFSNTIEGLRTIRVYKQQWKFTDKVYGYIDDHDKALFAYYTAVRWFSNTLDIFCVVFSTIVVTVVVLSITESSNAAVSAVTILYAVSTVQIVQFVLRLFAEVHSQMTSAERTLAYTKIEAEKGRVINRKPPENWPYEGTLLFKNVSLRHYDGGPQALRNVSLRINAAEKIGIAGRTGAGKSSLVSALMRMAEIEGQIIVDSINIMELNLQSTRRNISVISQSPILIRGSVRLNLDPSDQFGESEIWDVLEQMQMKPVIASLPNQLDSVIEDANSGFSVGEIQLLHLARVLLQKSKIIVFDEATGKVDEKTDELIQGVICNVFKDYTVITIAHRLSTIMGCDRVMVLDRGEIMEFDKPGIIC